MGIKRIVRFCSLLAILLLGSASMSGCWDYRNIEDLTIVAGIALDKSEDGEGYVLSFEIVDVASGGEIETSRIISTKGRNIFDAIVAGKEHLVEPLYFGNTELLVVSKQVAREEGVFPVINDFLRNAGMRETMFIVVSRGATAKEIITPPEGEDLIVSRQIARMIEDDKTTTNATNYIHMFQAYNIIKSYNNELVLPAFSRRLGEESPGTYDGLALFNGSRLINFMDRKDVQYYLLASQGIEGGLITFPAEEGDVDNTTIEVARCNTSRSVTYSGGRAKICIEITVSGDIKGTEDEISAMEEDGINVYAKQAEQVLRQRVKSVIEQLQNNPGVDYYGFGVEFYRTHYEQYRQIESNWNELFRNAEVEVVCTVDIVHTGLLKGR